MIKHHPKQALLLAHAEGNLPIAMTIAVAAHCEMCPVCQQQLAEIQIDLAEHIFSAEAEHSITHIQDSIVEPDIDDLIHQITEEPAAPTLAIQPIKVQVKQHQYTLPRAFNHQTKPHWQGLGKINRMRLNLDEGTTRASLLHIDAGGEIPEHTHCENELTLILDGEFHDHYGQYVAGDFILLDGNHQHSPQTKEGCLCYTVVDAPLHFTQGMSQLLNPIGKLIY